MRSGFNSRQGSHDLIAIRYLYSMSRGYRSRYRDTHKIMLSVAVSGFGVSRLATILHRGYRSRHRDTHKIMLSVAVSGFGVSRPATILHYTELCTRDSMRMD